MYMYVPQQPHSQVCPTHTAAGIGDASKTPETAQLQVVGGKERDILLSSHCIHSPQRAMIPANTTVPA